MLTVYGMTRNPSVIPEQPGNPELLHVCAESDLFLRGRGRENPGLLARYGLQMTLARELKAGAPFEKGICKC